MKAVIEKKRMKDRVATPRVETLWEKAALLAKQLPKKPRDKGCQNLAQPTNHEVVWDHSSNGGAGLGERFDGAV